MSASRIRMNSNGQTVPFFAGPVFSSANNVWSGYYFEEAAGPGEPVGSHSWSHTTLLSATSGEGSLNWKHLGISRTNRLARGNVWIIRRDAEIQSAAPSNQITMMVLQLDHSKLWHAAPDNILSIDEYLQSAQVADDQHLAALMAIMCHEVKEGCPSGRLFGETISLTMLRYLAARYAPAVHESNHAITLSTAEKRIIVDYVQANLTNNIAVTDLAKLVQMSPSHFTRLFRATFGITPYRFVMHERIEGAKGMIAGTQLSASDISSAYGFASQSHFTKVFRQFTGVTPKQFKFRVSDRSKLLLRERPGLRK